MKETGPAVDGAVDGSAVCAEERTLLTELIAKHALYENMALYCRGIDRKDLELVKSTFWPESTDDHGSFVGLSYDFCAMAFEAQKLSLHRANHYISNILVELDGDRAKRETAFIYTKVPVDGTPVDLLSGRYRDLCERRDGEWKVLSRTCIWDLAQRLNPEADYAELFGIPPSSQFGALYPHDPIYAERW